MFFIFYFSFLFKDFFNIEEIYLYIIVDEIDNDKLLNEYKNIIGNSSTSAMIATFIEQEEDISELERIEELIRKRMKELEEAQ